MQFLDEFWGYGNFWQVTNGMEEASLSPSICDTTVRDWLHMNQTEYSPLGTVPTQNDNTASWLLISTEHLTVVSPFLFQNWSTEK